MLNILRKQAQSTVIQLLVLIIAIVFVFWGVGTNLGSKRNALATVNGNEIPFEDYQRTYDTTIDNLRVQFGGTIPQGILDGLGIKQQVLNQLIQAEILRQGGRKMGVSISRLATQDEIKNMEVFQQNGQFDLERYKLVLSQNRMTPKSFETSLQNDLLAQRVNDSIRKFAIYPEKEVQFRHEFANEQIMLAYASFSADSFKEKVKIDEEHLNEWFDTQKNNYLTEQQIRLKYLFFSFADDLDKVNLDDEILQANYKANTAKYSTPEQRHARHILFKVSETDDAQTRADKKKKAEEILQLAQNGEDFVELAKQHSEGPTASTGGDLGFFGRGAMVEQFDTAVFQMNAGEVQGIVETVFGYHIIRLEEIRPEETKSFEEVKESIADALKQNNVKKITQERSKEAYRDIIVSGSIDKYSDEKGANVVETDFFTKSSPPESPVADPQFLRSAFSLKKGELSSLVEVATGYAIVFVDDIQPPAVPELESVREKVVDDFVKIRSKELALEAAETALEKSSETQELTAEALGGAELLQSKYIKRTNPADSGGIPVLVVQQAFERSQSKPLATEPVPQGDTYYVFQLLEKKLGEEPLDETQREVLSEQIAQSIQTSLMTGWLAWMKSSADIWINEQILQ